MIACKRGRSSETVAGSYRGSRKPHQQERSKMPKMKTKSGAKKRFKITGTGKVKFAQAGKRHGMIKRTAKFIQKARGTAVLSESDAKIVKKYMPYSR